MAKSRKIYRVNIQGMIVEEIDEMEDKEFEHINLPTSSEFVIFNNLEQAVPIPA